MISFKSTAKNTLLSLFSGLFLLTGTFTPVHTEISSPISTSNYENAAKLERIKHKSYQIANTFKGNAKSQAQSTKSSPKPAVASVKAVKVNIPNSIQIAGLSIPVFYSSDTRIDAGNKVALFRTNFLYGHNSANVFGRLASLPVGSTFKLTLGGTTKTYRIVKRITLTKADANKHIYDIAFGKFQNVQYSYSLMTCAGRALAGGDATHRLVLFAN